MVLPSAEENRGVVQPTHNAPLGSNKDAGLESSESFSEQGSTGKAQGQTRRSRKKKRKDHALRVEPSQLQP